MASATEPMHAGEFLRSYDGNCLEDSNENVVVLSGQVLAAGELVGLVDIAGVGSISIPSVVGTGNGTASLVTAGPLAQVGNYVATCTAAASHGGVFTIVAPDGKTVGVFTMGTTTGGTAAFKSPHINFSLTDGSSDFIVGDSFTFVVGTTVPAVIGGTGTGVMSAITLGPKAQRGNYLVINRVVLANGGHFEVVAPDGSSVGIFPWSNSGSTASFTSDHINFTLSDATDFIAGNYFNVAVYGPAAKAKAVQYDPRPTTYDGRHRLAGIAWDAYDASSGDVKGVVTVRKCSVKGDLLTGKASLTAADLVAAKATLTAMGVVVR